MEGKKISALLPKSWEKLLDSGLFIPTKMRFSNERNDKNCVIKVIIKSMKTKNLKLNWIY